ncbi:MAG: AarF/ABC1/UbiB kinase family protein, partial [Phycisphaerae bacterium]|nr:AarF/ABC1/UbiB kinase family protein [Phycisphaerae bacterium]
MITLAPRHLARYAQIARLLVKYGRSDLVDRCGLRAAAEEGGDPPVETGRPEEFASDLERLGPTFVKLGQLLSTRSDLLPPAYLDALARLQDDVEPVDVDEVRSVIESELGVRISSAFDEFDDRPLAAASLAQVHRARLRSGQEVAVKVLRPDIREQVSTDLDAINELARTLDQHAEFARRYGFLSIAESLQESMRRELDLRTEAQSARALAGTLSEFERFRVPQPIDDFCSASVLTMEYISGTKITDLSPAVLIEVDRRGLADELFRVYLKQILVDGLF